MVEEGYYFDPKHGGCLRKIAYFKKNNTYQIIGAYGNDEPDTGKKWTAVINKTNKVNIFKVNFSGKKHITHGDYTFKWNKRDRKLYWEDGNVWILMYDWYG